MIGPLRLAILIYGIVISGMGCGKAPNPEEMLTEARRVFKEEQDYSKALSLFEQIQNRSTKPEPTETQLSYAEFNAIRCHIALNNPDVFRRIEIISDRLSVYHYLRLIKDFVDHGKYLKVWYMMAALSKRFPDDGDKFNNGIIFFDTEARKKAHQEKMKKLSCFFY